LTAGGPSGAAAPLPGSDRTLDMVRRLRKYVGSVYPSARERPDSAELQPFAVASNGVTTCSRRSAVQLGFFSFQPSTTRRPARSIVKLTGNRQIRPYPGALERSRNPTGKLSDSAIFLTSGSLSGVSSVKASTRSPASRCRVAYPERSGSSSRHGAHQVAQKVRMMTSPRSWAVEMLCPSRVTRVAAGAAAPTLRSLARASRASQPVRPHTLHAHARRFNVRARGEIGRAHV